jgi:hypothetical protein
MLTAEAFVETEHPARYLVRLGRHASQLTKRRLHRPRGHGGDGTFPEVQSAEWSDTDGTVRLSWGQWTMQAAPGTLRLRAEAADEENLRRIQELLTARLERFGRRDQLTVRWQRPESLPAKRLAADNGAGP